MSAKKRKRRIRMPAAPLMDRIPDLKDYSDQDGDTMVSLEALRLIARQCDDVYTPAIDDLQDDVDALVDQDGVTLRLIKVLIESVKRDKQSCLEMLDLGKLVVAYIRNRPMMFFMALAVLIFLLPLLRDFAEIFLVGAVDKMFNINLREILPLLFGARQ